MGCRECVRVCVCDVSYSFVMYFTRILEVRNYLQHLNTADLSIINVVV